MKMTISDAELLKKYVDANSNEAFESLISRYSGLVYSAALRQIPQLEMAEDIAQSVFIDLARKANRLPENVILSGWLYRATCYAASKAIRSEQRRALREREAFAMDSIDTNGDSVWKQIEPYLDAAMNHLSDRDRTSLILRYFENHSLREVGASLGISEDAAQKRVSRALEKLRNSFTQKRIRVTSTVLAFQLSSFAVEAAPTLLTTSISTAVSSAAIGSGGTAAITSLLNHLIMISKTKIAIAAGVAVAITQFAIHQKTTSTLERDAETLRSINKDLRASQATPDLPASILAELNQLRDKASEIPKLRGEIVALRQQNQALKQATPGSPELDESSKNDPSARMHFADEMIKAGNYAEALTHLIWCYDEGLKHQPSFVGVRSSFLLGRFAKLGQSYPPAQEALVARRDAAVEAWKANTNDRTLANDITRINSALGEGEMTVALFDQLPKGEPSRALLVESAFDELLKAKKYDDIFAAMTPESYFQKRLRSQSMIRDRMPDNERLQTSMLDRLVFDGGMVVETLAGVNQAQRAIDVIDQVIEQDASRETIEDLLRHATRANNADVIHYLENQ